MQSISSRPIAGCLRAWLPGSLARPLPRFQHACAPLPVARIPDALQVGSGPILPEIADVHSCG